jgi:twitching motility protein PilJ
VIPFKSALGRLKVWHKLALITGTLLIPILVLALLLTQNVNEQEVFIEKELAGLEYLEPLARIERLVPQHRGQSAAVHAGDTTQRDALAATQRELDEALKAVEPIDAKHGRTLKTTEKWKALQNTWVDLKAAGPTLTAEQSYARHTELMAKVLELAGIVGDESNLIYDPVNISYALQDSIVYRIPTHMEYVAQARALAVKAAAQKSIKPEERTRLIVLKGKIESSRDLVKTNVDLIAEKGSPETRGRVERHYAAAATATEAFLVYLDKHFIESPQVTADVRETWNIGTAATDAYLGSNGAYEASVPALRDILVARLDGHKRTQAYAIAAIVLGTLLSLAIIYLVLRGINRQVKGLQATFARIGMGDFTARTPVTSGDELGQVATALNATLDNTLTLIQSREERDTIQASIMRLLEEVSGVADGDLTTEVAVDAEVMGAVADSFNYMIGQLRLIIGNVQKATKQVTSTAADVSRSAEQLARGSESQAAQIVLTSTAVEEMAASVRHVSENAGVSADVARQALDSARQGNAAVRNTMAGMDRIRDQVQETAKRIKRLGESTQEIGQIIQLIDDIADRTSILALNASIQAAMAGEAGRGFAVVAEEVERLADRSTDATKKIGTLVKTIQSETTEAVAAMEKGIQEVVDGSRLASQAGQALGEIESVSHRLSDLIQSISQASAQQAHASQGVAKSMAEISEVTQQTAQGTKQAASAVNGLARLAQELRGSVSRFKLPGAEAAEVAPAIAHANGHTNGAPILLKGTSRF